MENLHPPGEQDKRQFIALIGFSLLLSLLFLLFEENAEGISSAFPPGKVFFTRYPGADGQMWGEPKVESDPPALTKIAINTAPMEYLDLCPGIGSATARRLIQERTVRPFSSWNDVVERLPGFGTARVRALQEAGVKLNE